MPIIPQLKKKDTGERSQRAHRTYLEEFRLPRKLSFYVERMTGIACWEDHSAGNRKK